MACGGTRDVPIQIGAPTSNVKKGGKVYSAVTVAALARQLVTDIEGLTINYAQAMADDALNIEENYVITYTFAANAGTAKMSQFKVVSTILAGKKVDMTWEIFQVTVNYKAERDIIVHARRRRRFVGGGRRRCATTRQSRGVTSAEVAKIQATLTAVINKVGSKTLKTFVRAKTQILQRGQIILLKVCPAWKIVVQVSIQRVCYKKQ